MLEFVSTYTHLKVYYYLSRIRLQVQIHRCINMAKSMLTIAHCNPISQLHFSALLWYLNIQYQQRCMISVILKVFFHTTKLLSLQDRGPKILPYQLIFKILRNLEHSVYHQLLWTHVLHSLHQSYHNQKNKNNKNQG